MWEYTDEVLDHFRSPRNIGRIENPDGEGQVGSMSCGDALKLMFSVGEDGRIVDAKFQTFGCGSAIASASVLTTLIAGKTIEEAAAITNQDIVDHLGGLPPQKLHCSVMGREALEAAIANYRGEEYDATDHEDERVVCTCFGVTEEQIKTAIREHGITSAEEIANFTKAGGGCGGCIEDIEAIIQEATGAGSRETDTADAPPKRITNIQKMRMIEETIEREIRPSLQRDGGDIELVDIDGDTVLVELRGACANCPMSRVTLSDFVQAKLREFVSEQLVVMEGDADEGLPG